MRVILVLVVLCLVAAAAGCGARNEESPVTIGGSSAVVVAGSVPAAVHGTVRAADGSPVVEVMVTASSLEVPPRAVPELAVLTDETGAYEWPLAPGRYRLEVTDGHGSAAADVTVVGGVGPVVNLTLSA